MYVYLKHLLANQNSLFPLNVAVRGRKGKCSEAQVLQVKTQRKANGIVSHLPVCFIRDQRMKS
jgi:hypothetical protein